MSHETPLLRRRQARTIPGDLILPLGIEDDNWTLRTTLVGALFQFDDVLDAHKLQAALSRLLEQDGWRKLGARLRIGIGGALEYHIPQTYSEQRPGYQWSQAAYDIPMQAHAEATRIPSASEGTVTFTQATSLESLTYAPGAPAKVEDFLVSDSAQLSVRVVNFRNGTTIGLSFLHTLMDVMSLSDVMQAWMRSLQGCEKGLAPLHGFDVDPLANLGSTSESQQWLLSQYVLTGFKALMFVTKLLQKAMFGETIEQKWICLPTAYVKALRKRTAQELRDMDRKTEKSNCLSVGDVAAGWLTRLALQQMEYLSPVSLKQRDVVVVSSYSLRELHAEDILPVGKAYLGNSMSVLYTIEPIGQVIDRSVSWLVSRFRASVAAQGQRAQQELAYKTNREHIRIGGRPALVGTAQGLVVNWYNWHKANLFEVDMSPAVVSVGRGERRSAGGRPCFVNVEFKKQSRLFSAQNTIWVTGEDSSGNYWLSGVFETAVWDGIQRALKDPFQGPLHS